MKKYIIIYLFVSILAIDVIANEIENPVNNAVKAEKLWMEIGFNTLFINIQRDFRFNDAEITAFKNKYFKELYHDKIEFFTNSSLNENFLIDTVNDNYKNWLTNKQIFYYKQAQNFALESKELLIIDSTQANYSMISPSTCAHNDCTNIGFEVGDLSSWNEYTGIACIDPSFGSHSCHSFTNPIASPAQIEIQSGTGFDPFVNSSKLPVVCPGGSYSLRIENTLLGGHASKITRDFIVNTSNSMYLYKYAVVLEDPGNSHLDEEKPFFSVKMYVLDNSCNIESEIDCASYSVYANPNNPEIKHNFFQVPLYNFLYYKKWTTVAIPLDEHIGKKVRIEFVVSDCAYGGHLGYAYIDGECLNSTPTIGPCVDGKRELTAPLGFNSYWWSGDDIDGQNYNNKIRAGRGFHRLLATTVTKCKREYILEVDSCPPISVVNCNISSLTATPFSCNVQNNNFDLNGTITFSSSPSTGVLIISNGYLSQIYNLPLTSPFNFTFNNLVADGQTHTLKAVFYKSNFISSEFISCQLSISYTSPNACFFPTIPCENCLTSFNPEPGRYIISAWVKDVYAASDVETYLNPYIEIEFSGGTIILPKMYPSGKIIERWQRVFYEFTIPIGATDISINLGTNSGAVLFDDIRIHPANGSFVSYVYDPVSLKLVATLDDNNYATIYEYDNEGTLLRVKKETERGIMTIKESRENSPKR